MNKLTENQHTALAKLVLYVLENEIWRNTPIFEDTYIIRMASYKLKLSQYSIKSYINRALNKLIGTEYVLVQNEVKRNCGCYEKDLLYKKPVKKIISPNKCGPRTPFGIWFFQHYGYSKEHIKEYNKLYKDWKAGILKIEKEGE